MQAAPDLGPFLNIGGRDRTVSLTGHIGRGAWSAHRTDVRLRALAGHPIATA
jgi:hypothetical protein